MSYNDKAWQDSMRIKVDLNNLFNSNIGPNGFTDKDFRTNSEAASDAKKYFDTHRGKGMMGWTELPYKQKEVIEDIKETAKFINEKFEYFVVLGIGGSALGPIAVHQALCHLRYNELDADKRKGPKFYVEDNIDPERMKALLDVIDVRKTMFNVITKSGSTSETMSQFLIIWDILTEIYGRADAAKHIIATTDEKNGNLIRIAKAEGFKTFYIPDGVGGRFSELSPVGLLPAAVCGIDICSMINGAAYMDGICTSDDYHENPALAYALAQYIAMNKGINISVMMPYSDALKYISDWFAQLWAESLGKKYNLQGNVVNTGQTPVRALGVTDQHSQIQLYTEGPNDKIITFLSVDSYRAEIEIPLNFEDIPSVSFLGEHTLNELIQAERIATEYALTKAGKLNCTINLPVVTSFTVGQLLYFFMLATSYCGAMLGINTFDQPGVEEGKNATYALLGRVGYEEKRDEILSAPQDNPKYIF